MGFFWGGVIIEWNEILIFFKSTFLLQLKELQRKYGNDDRFKLSEKFLDSDDANGNVEEMRNFLTDNGK